jgi:hypothetical protein
MAAELEREFLGEANSNSSLNWGHGFRMTSRWPNRSLFYQGPFRLQSFRRNTQQIKVYGSWSRIPPEWVVVF